MVGTKTIDIQARKPIDEEKIEALAFQVLNAEKDEERIVYNEELKTLLSIELSKSSAFKHPFSKIKSMIVLCPPDSSFRLFNWNIPFNDGTFQYECGILSKRSDFFFLSPIDEDSLLDMQAVTSKNEWISGLIYEIIPKKTDLQLYYTLLVWDGNNRLTEKKRIDVLWFDQLGDVRFGAPIFEKEEKKHNRVLFEFSSQESMKMRYNSITDQIEFDLLVPIRPDYEGIYEYYFPAVTQDAYHWENNHWTFQELINPDDGKKNDRKKVERELREKKKKMIQTRDSIFAPQ